MCRDLDFLRTKKGKYNYGDVYNVCRSRGENYGEKLEFTLRWFFTWVTLRLHMRETYIKYVRMIIHAIYPN